jgi:hypothetical protein
MGKNSKLSTTQARDGGERVEHYRRIAEEHITYPEKEEHSY